MRSLGVREDRLRMYKAALIITYELHPSGWRVQAGQPGGGRFMKNPPDWLTR
jgi:hypothetical protein